jgi:hypothetical protein
MYTTDLDSSDFPAGTKATLTAMGYAPNQKELCARLIDADTGVPVDASSSCFTPTSGPSDPTSGKLTATFALPAGAHTYAVQYESSGINAALQRIDLRLHW